MSPLSLLRSSVAAWTSASRPPKSPTDEDMGEEATGRGGAALRRLGKCAEELARIEEECCEKVAVGERVCE